MTSEITRGSPAPAAPVRDRAIGVEAVADEQALR